MLVRSQVLRSTTAAAAAAPFPANPVPLLELLMLGFPLTVVPWTIGSNIPTYCTSC